MRNEFKKAREKERKKKTEQILKVGKTEGHKKIVHYFSVLCI
jgi:hypothetical protein